MTNNNYLFRDVDTGYIFYVNTVYFEDAEQIANNITGGRAEYIRLDDNFTASWNDYNTY